MEYGKIGHLQPLVLNGNLKEKWKRFRQRFEVNLAATELDKKSEKVQACQFLHAEALDVYNSFTWEEDDHK